MSGPAVRVMLAPVDASPFTASERHTCRVVGLTLKTWRMGTALLDRAPVCLMAAWAAEELTTCEAYSLLLRCEGPDGALMREVIERVIQSRIGEG
ncbi:hypothetical protein GCM10008957_38190 [Deinococcus ruber]|uniref:Uncharacterized protein n=1 Tax=Deinococcus ruber TaxID=1848197 RepID=A0A918FCK3_9DEIO|nr:hypothetical protein GCM10008957_38190 [Deinococcus ruber]